MRLFFRVSSTLVLACGTVLVAPCQSATSAACLASLLVRFRQARSRGVTLIKLRNVAHWK